MACEARASSLGPCRYCRTVQAQAACCRETDLDEVLQSTTVFSSVSKGVLAKKEDLELVFGTADEEKVCLKILAEGEFQVSLPATCNACDALSWSSLYYAAELLSSPLQVSDKEREVELQNLFKDVASVLAEKCINPQNHRPYTITMLERALRDMHFSVDPKRNAKQQALAVRLVACACTSTHGKPPDCVARGAGAPAAADADPDRALTDAAAADRASLCSSGGQGQAAEP